MLAADDLSLFHSQLNTYLWIVVTWIQGVFEIIYNSFKNFIKQTFYNLVYCLFYTQTFIISEGGNVPLEG